MEYNLKSLSSFMLATKILYKIDRYQYLKENWGHLYFNVAIVIFIDLLSINYTSFNYFLNDVHHNYPFTLLSCHLTYNVLILWKWSLFFKCSKVIYHIVRFWCIELPRNSKTSTYLYYMGAYVKFVNESNNLQDINVPFQDL